MISLIIILSYIIYVIETLGIPKSLSSSYYKLKYKFIFSVTLILSSITILPSILEIEIFSFLPFICILGILFVSATPNFNNLQLEYKVHMYSAIIALITSLIWVGIINLKLLWIWMIIVLYYIYNIIKYKSLKQAFDNSNVKFWAEIIMLLTIYNIIL